MESAATQSTTTTTRPPPADVEHVELQVLPAGLPTTTEPSQAPGNADPDDPEENEVDALLPLGVKLTGYRLLNLVVLLGIGLFKFILSLQGQSIAPTGLEWVGGSVLAAL